MAFFANALNVDVRNSQFNQIGGSQVNYYGNPSRRVQPSRPSGQQPPQSLLQRSGQPSPSRHLPVVEFILPEEDSAISHQRQQPDRVLAPPPTTSNAPILHAKQLPTIDAFLDVALTSLKTKFSPWKNPREWIQEDTKYLGSIVRAIHQLTTSAEITLADFTGKEMIYPRLVLYVFAHLMYTSDKTSFNELKRTLEKWKTWDGLAMIQNQQAMRGYLQQLFQRSLQPESDLHSNGLFNKLLTLDVIRLSAYLTLTVTDDVKYKACMKLRGEEAQSLINLLQARLDFYIDPDYKPRHIKALIKLSCASGQYPECLALTDIDIEEHPVASGGYGDVYRGRMNSQLMAVKVLKVYGNQDIAKFLKDFSSEAVIWRQLSHPNVLPFCGVYHPADSTRRVCLVAPWLENGNVVEFLKKNPDTNCLQLALDVALGLEYLHSLTPIIIHGDLKGLNILITRCRRACLADFGVAVLNSQTLAMTHASTAKSVGTVRWQAPELHDFDLNSASESVSPQNNKATDIYAFACVCYEMLSGQIPFHNITQEMQVLRRVLQGIRPTRPLYNISRDRGLTDDFWNLIQTCWAQDPAERPTATEVVRQLRSLPDRPQDTRSFDDLHISTPSQMVYKKANHPFSSLGPNDEDDDVVQALKCMSR